MNRLIKIEDNELSLWEFWNSDFLEDMNISREIENGTTMFICGNTADTDEIMKRLKATFFLEETTVTVL